MSITTTYDFHQKILDLQIICSKKDIEIYKLKKQINSLLNDAVFKNDEPLEKEEEIKEVTQTTPSLPLEKIIQVKVKECGECRREDRKMFSTKGYKCEDEECMYFKN